MTLADDEIVDGERLDPPAPKKGWASRHPRIAILFIAGIFYIVLFSMCAFVFVLLLRG